VPARRRFQLVLVKPSHYDDDGYVIRWWRAMIPSNSLAAVYGIAADCAERQVSGRTSRSLSMCLGKWAAVTFLRLSFTT
jgi:hypothetical protein